MSIKDLLAIKQSMHFDYPEAWYLKGSVTFSEGSKFGTWCVYFPNENSYVSISNTTGMYNLSPYGNYEFEAFVKLEGNGSIFTIGGLALVGLALVVTSSNTLQLTSTTWRVDATTTTTLDTNTWYHLLLRISGETVKLFIDGVEALSEPITGNTIKPSTVILGKYIGYMDEFVFRRNAGSSAPTVPTQAYGTEEDTDTVIGGIISAPVSKAAWRCENLPEGLMLSESGLLSGRPTTAGTYECEFTVATNWGTDTKTVKITVE